MNAFVAISSLYDSSTSEPQSTLSYLTVLYLSDKMSFFRKGNIRRIEEKLTSSSSDETALAAVCLSVVVLLGVLRSVDGRSVREFWKKRVIEKEDRAGGELAGQGQRERERKHPPGR